MQGDDGGEPLLHPSDSSQESDEANPRRARAAHALAEESKYHQASFTSLLENLCHIKP